MQSHSQESLIRKDDFSTAMVISMTGITLRQLYYWERLGYIHPAFEQFGQRFFRRYRQEDADLIFQIAGYLKEGFKLKTAAQKAMENFCSETDLDKKKKNQTEFKTTAEKINFE